MASTAVAQKQGIINATQSCALIRNLMRLSLSTIACARTHRALPSDDARKARGSARQASSHSHGLRPTRIAPDSHGLRLLGRHARLLPRRLLCQQERALGLNGRPRRPTWPCSHRAAVASIPTGRNVHGVLVKSLGTEECDDHARALLGWLEQGVFSALDKGYLEKAILCVAADETGDEMLEAWALAVSWWTDEEGVQHPTIRTSIDNKRVTRSLNVKGTRKKYTLSYVRETSQAMLRQMMMYAPAHALAPTARTRAACARPGWWRLPSGACRSAAFNPRACTGCCRRSQRSRRYTGSRCACSTAMT